MIPEFGEIPALLIIAPETKIIQIIPTASKNVIKITIHIDRHCGDILENLHQFYKTEKLEVIYSTAIMCACFNVLSESETYDTMEVYLDLGSNKYSLVEFKQKVEQVEGVAMVEITPVQVSVASSEKKEEKEWFDLFIAQARNILRRRQYQKVYLKILEIIYLNEHPTIEIISNNLESKYPLSKIKYFIGYLMRKKLVLFDNHTNTFYLSKNIIY